MEIGETIGEKRVRLKFNPAKSDTVTTIKTKCAELINLIEEIKGLSPREASIAQTEIESACHWAVKVATTNL
jgi:hypothetical protein